MKRTPTKREEGIVNGKGRVITIKMFRGKKKPVKHVSPRCGVLEFIGKRKMRLGMRDGQSNTTNQSKW